MTLTLTARGGTGRLTLTSHSCQGEGVVAKRVKLASIARHLVDGVGWTLLHWSWSSHLSPLTSPRPLPSSTRTGLHLPHLEPAFPSFARACTTHAGSRVEKKPLVRRRGAAIRKERKACISWCIAPALFAQAMRGGKTVRQPGTSLGLSRRRRTPWGVTWCGGDARRQTDPDGCDSAERESG